MIEGPADASPARIVQIPDHLPRRRIVVPVRLRAVPDGPDPASRASRVAQRSTRELPGRNRVCMAVQEAGTGDKRGGDLSERAGRDKRTGPGTTRAGDAVTHP